MAGEAPAMRMVQTLVASGYRSVRVKVGSVAFAAHAADPALRTAAVAAPVVVPAAEAATTVASPSPGWVDVHVAPGDAVEEGVTVATVRTHLGQHAVAAPIDGRVAAVDVAAQQFVGSGTAILTIAATS